MPDEFDIDRGIRGHGQAGRLVAELAGGQHGMVARRQLPALGLSGDTIDRWVAAGRLHVVHRGVYSVGHRSISPDGWRMAAALRGGPGAVLSHASAAGLWGMRPWAGGRHHVTVPRSLRQSRPVRFHFGALPDDEVTAVRGIPVTTVPRTLLDRAAELRPAQLEREMNQADVLRLTDPLSLADLLERYPGRAGAPTARSVLRALGVGLGVTREELEARFHDFLAALRVPRPELNVWLLVGGRLYQVDCLWREYGLIAEIDGRAAHGTAAAFEADRARDRALVTAGWRVIRVTWRQLHEEAAALAADLRRLLDPRPAAARA